MQYDDLINYPYPYKSNRKKMSMVNRGAQFAPFAALTGYDALIHEEARFTSEKNILSEEAIQELNQKLHYLQNHPFSEYTFAITYFEKDLKKAGGTYQNYIGTIKKIIAHEQKLMTSNHIFIHFDDLYDIQSNFFPF